MSRKSQGLYCLTPASGIDPQTRTAVVSVELSYTAPPRSSASATYRFNGIDCPSGQFEVVTERLYISGGTLISGPANDVGFTIIVP